MKKFYAYLDKADILHVVSEPDGLEKWSKTGRYVETEMQGHHGYPVWVIDGKEEDILMYAEDDMRLSSKSPKLPVIPELAEFYRFVKESIGA